MQCFGIKFFSLQREQQVLNAGQRIWNTILHNNNRLKPAIQQECAVSETKKNTHPKTASGLFCFQPTLRLLNIAISRLHGFNPPDKTIKTLLPFTKLGITLNLYTAAPTCMNSINTHISCVSQVICSFMWGCQHGSHSDKLPATRPQSQSKYKSATQQSCAIPKPVNPKYLFLCLSVSLSQA